MRKALLITIVFLLLTLSMTQSAIAQRQNIITNQTTEPLYVVYSTKFGAHDVIPAGYWTAGWKEIQAGQQEAFWAYDPHKIYFQIWKGSQRVKPLSSTQTLAFWVNRDADFNVVTQQEINASITRGQLVYSSHDTSALTHSDGFMRYNNGSRIAVTNAWVDVPDVPADDAMADDGEAEDADGDEISDGAEDGGDDGPFDGAAAIVSIDPPQVAPPVGSQLTIHLKIANAQNVLGYQATVNFDPSALRYVSSENADYLPVDAFLLPPRVSEGKVLFFGIGTGTEVGGARGTLATVTFEVVASEKPMIWLTDMVLAGSDGSVLAVTTRGGSPQGERPFPSGDDDSAEDRSMTEEDPEDHQVGVDPGAPKFVNIPDPNLRAAIERALVKKSTITLTDMLKLTSLEAENAGIEDLTGIEFATNLTELYLRGNRTSDVAPLTHLKKLKALGLGSNQLSDISPLAQLKNLVELDLGGNQLSDISPLNQLKQLNWLYLSRNQIVDVFPLAQLTNLTALYLSYNQISDFSALAELVKRLERYQNDNQTPVGPNAPVTIPDPNLRSAIEEALGKTKGAAITRADMQTLTKFEGEGRGIQNLTGIEFAENLELLDLSDNEVSDLSPLAGLTHLKVLDLSHTAISDVSVLAGLTNLVKLHLNSTAISDVSALAGLTNLIRLDLSHTAISDVSALAELTHLKVLDLDNTAISDVSALAGLTHLKVLYLDNTAISDVSALAGLTNLVKLSLYNAAISDVSALAGLTNLVELYLNENAISDVSALAGLINLKVLYLNENAISDVSALAGLTNLVELWIDRNRIADFAPITEVVKNLRSYENGAQLKDPIPNSVELSGPTTVTSVVGDYTFTAKVQNAMNQGVGGVEVTVNGKATTQTNSAGRAVFKLNFPSVGGTSH